MAQREIIMYETVATTFVVEQSWLDANGVTADPNGELHYDDPDVLFNRAERERAANRVSLEVQERDFVSNTNFSSSTATAL